jgi:mono/diheme cytochrome c family protein
MSKFFLSTAVLILVAVVLGACVLVPPPPMPSRPATPMMPATQGDADAGAQAWASSPCAGCHGANAEGKIGPMLAGTQLSLDQVKNKVHQGTSGMEMPRFSAEQVSDADIANIYAWLTSVSAGAQVWASSPCAGCHGANAEGKIGPMLAGTQLSLDQIKNKVHQGASGMEMPRFSADQVSDADIASIYAWLTSLSAGAQVWASSPCAGCHGPNAEGKIGPRLTGTELSLDQVKNKVHQGASGMEMPRFSADQVSDADIANIYIWLKGK